MVVVLLLDSYTDIFSLSKYGCSYTFHYIFMISMKCTFKIVLKAFIAPSSFLGIIQ